MILLPALLQFSDDRLGSCWCAGSNFGSLYCAREPKYYYMSSKTGKSYKGDYHPEYEDDMDPKAFETKPPKCNNCGEIALCLKPGYR